MPAPPPGRPATSSSTGHEDGLGRRSLVFDRAEGCSFERLALRPEFGVFEAHLRERAGRLAGRSDERVARTRRVHREHPAGPLLVDSDLPHGERLIDLLATSGDGNPDLVGGVDIAVGFLLEILPALDALHREAGFAHGAIAPGRLLLSPTGRIVLLDPIFGAAIPRIGWSRRRLWRDLGLAAPTTAGPPRFTPATDISQAGLTALMLLLGRPLREDEYPDGLAAVRTEAVEIAEIRGNGDFASAFGAFLDRALVLRPPDGFGTAREAEQNLLDVVEGAMGVAACRTALSGVAESLARAPAVARLPETPGRPAAAPPRKVVVEPPRAAPALELRIDVPTVRPPAAIAVPEPTPAPPVPAPPALEPPAPVPPAPEPQTLAAPMPEPPAPEPQTLAAPMPEPPVLAPPAPAPRAPEPAASEPPAPAVVPAPATEAITPAREVPEPVAARPAPPSRRRSKREKRRSDALRSNKAPVHPVRVAPTPLVVVSPPPPPMPHQPVFPQAGGYAAPASSQSPYGSGERAWQVPSLPQQPLAKPETPPQPAATTIALKPVQAPLRFKKDERPVRPAPRLAAAPVEQMARPSHGAHRAARRGFPWRIAAAVVVLIGGAIASRGFLADRVAESVSPPAVEAVAAPGPATPSTGSLVLTSTPTGARVLIDGQPAGETPLALDEVAPGRRVVTFVSPAGTVRRTVRVAAGQSATVDVLVTSGWLAVDAPVVLEVATGGKVIGSTQQNRLLLPPGRHTVTLSNTDLGYRAAHVVDIEPGDERRLSVSPTSPVNLNASPWAEVWIDGKRIGETPIAKVLIPLGTREIVFRHPDLGERRLTPTIKVGDPVAISVDFTRPHQP